jgi:ankyrin repeat protein
MAVLLRHCKKEEADLRNWEGHTALYIAAHEEAEALVKILLQGGADPALHYEGGLTLLMTTWHRGIAERLLEHGAPINACDHEGHTALLYACVRGLVSIAALFLDRGANIFARDEENRTCLILAASASNTALVKVILAHPSATKAFVDAAGKEGATALHYAVDADDVVSAKALLQAHADVNVADAYGTTPLLSARSFDMARLLLGAGADTRMVDIHGRTALMNARSAAIASLLLHADASATDVRDRKNRLTTMYFARSRLLLPALEELLQSYAARGVDAGVRDVDAHGDTALHMAMMGCNPDGVSLLLARGARALGVGRDGATTLIKPFVNPPQQPMAPGEVDAHTSACLELLLEGVLRAMDAGEELY